MPLPLVSALEDIDRAFFGVGVEAGKQVLGAMMEHDRTALCGLPWKPDEGRAGRRAGSTASPVTLGGRRIAVRRPRVRSVDGEELGLPSFEAATDRDPLDRHTRDIRDDSSIIWQQALSNYLSGLTQSFDFILLDCPGSLGAITVNVFLAPTP